MKITCTNGNSINHIRGSRVTIIDDGDNVVDCFEVPTRNGKRYCEIHPSGEYGRRYIAAIMKAVKNKGNK